MINKSREEIRRGSREKRAKDKRAYKKREREKLAIGETIQGKEHKYEVVELLGSGGFGDVYKIIDENGASYAMKTEMDSAQNKQFLRLKLETQILLECAKIHDPDHKVHFVTLYDRGKTDKLKFMVMGLVGPSIHDLRKDYLGADFCKNSAWTISLQALEAIGDLHSIGYIHRDIKPQNFAIGLAEQQSRIYMLDFGISRKYIKPDGTLKIPRTKTKFIGTVRFASRGCHIGMEQSRRDDLEVWCYMLVDLFGQELIPWRRKIDKEEVLAMKRSFFNFNKKYGNIFTKVPPDFRRVMKYIDDLTYEAVPDYSMIKDNMLAIARSEGIDVNAPFEWIGKPKIPPKKKYEYDPVKKIIEEESKDKDVEESSEEEAVGRPVLALIKPMLSGEGRNRSGGTKSGKSKRGGSDQRVTKSRVDQIASSYGKADAKPRVARRIKSKEKPVS